MNPIKCLMLGALSVTVPFFAGAGEQDPQSASQGAVVSKQSSPLVEKVRQATARYRDINVALAEGWVMATPCVSGPNHGAMGVHLALPARVGDGEVNGSEPELLMYEPQANGGMRLVGVEFVVIAADWTRENPGGGPPSVDGHLMHFVGEPNRYGLPAFYAFHVWAWARNPDGFFADWNRLVTCNKQPIP
jgi:hypothetical protein